MKHYSSSECKKSIRAVSGNTLLTFVHFCFACLWWLPHWIWYRAIKIGLKWWWCLSWINTSDLVPLVAIMPPPPCLTDNVMCFSSLALLTFVIFMVKSLWYKLTFVYLLDEIFSSTAWANAAWRVANVHSQAVWTSRKFRLCICTLQGSGHGKGKYF